jgi:hypothetical protein
MKRKSQVIVCVTRDLIANSGFFVMVLFWFTIVMSGEQHKIGPFLI